ncbi:MAG TPA: helix-turn-helix domain-containing protein [Sphingobium sp.]|nr:helix-turn-helix domain-containing protein [Sphingobium sp.]
MALISTFSTATSPDGLRLDSWNAFLQSAFPGIVVDGSRDIRCHSKTFLLGDISVSKIRSERATIRRWTTGSAITSRGRAKLHIQSAGISTSTQRERTVSLSAGDATCVLSDEPYELEISDRNVMLVIEFPLSILHGRTIQPGAAIDRSAPVSGVLRAMAGSLFDQHWPDDIAGEEAQGLGASIAQLISLVVTNIGAPLEQDSSDLRRRIFAFIDGNISDSAMRTGRIADALGIQARDVQAVFAELATTPTAYIIDRRLSLAAQRLTGTMTGQPGLTDLAYDLGFSDAAHFCRRFKSRFGVSPGAFARQRDWH